MKYKVSSEVDWFPATAVGHGSRRHLYKKDDKGKINRNVILRDCSHHICRQAFDRTGPTGPHGERHIIGQSSNYQSYMADREFGNITKAERVERPQSFTPVYVHVLGGVISTDGGRLHWDDWMYNERQEARAKVNLEGSKV